MRIRWIYLIILAPTLTEWIENGCWPDSPRQVMTDLILTAVLAALAWQVCHQHARLSAMAETDGLTGLLNSRRFQDDLRDEIARSRRLRTPLALAYLDLDRFKAVNDRFGHPEGDAVLRRLAGLLAATVRKRVDRCYRMGGDEFAILIPGSTSAEAAGILERIRILAAGEPTELARYGAGLSGGGVELRSDEDPLAFLKRADALMYAAKAGGKDRIAS